MFRPCMLPLLLLLSLVTRSSAFTASPAGGLTRSVRARNSFSSSSARDRMRNTLSPQALQGGRRIRGDSRSTIRLHMNVLEGSGFVEAANFFEGASSSIAALNLDWTQYAFMFPLSICTAIAAQVAGIGGAALFTPIFILVFPLLGPEYTIGSSTAALACALLTEAFGFSSGLLAYKKKGLIDVKAALPFLAVSLPACLAGALLSPWADEQLLKGIYSLLMISVSAFLLKELKDAQTEGRPEVLASIADVPDDCTIDYGEGGGDFRFKCASDGTDFIYESPKVEGKNVAGTAFGGLLMGLLGVGVGEVVLPQLTKKYLVPLPVAAGTSVLVVFLNAVTAAATQLAGLVSQGSVPIPYNLVAFTIPGVIIGGQIGPRLQGKVDPVVVETAVAVVFAFIGLAFATVTVKSLTTGIPAVG